jgi:hypothetical protein
MRELKGYIGKNMGKNMREIKKNIGKNMREIKEYIGKNITNAGN